MFHNPPAWMQGKVKINMCIWVDLMPEKMAKEIARIRHENLWRDDLRESASSDRGWQLAGWGIAIFAVTALVAIVFMAGKNLSWW